MHSRVAFAIEQDQSIGLELEIGTDLGSRVAGWSGDLRACQSLRTATHPAFQRLSDLLETNSKSISYDPSGGRLQKSTVLFDISFLSGG